jgi:glycosyltransferase involved in cell wall biosynthesis
MNNASIKVSICMLTYNHEKFIAQTLDSFVNQQTNFEVEVIIGEDASTDNTKKICLDYSNRYANILVSSEEKNIGMMTNFVKTLNRCSGDYVAICEGDDYWTDSLKLQKQVNFLQNNPEYVGCFHNVSEMKDNKIINHKKHNYIHNVFTQDDIINYNPIPALSIVFKNIFKGNYPLWFVDCKMGDWPLNILLSSHGKFKYIDETMGVYRIHENGSYIKFSKEKWFRDVTIPTFNTLQKNTDGLLSKKIFIRKIKDQVYLSKITRQFSQYCINIYTIFKYNKISNYTFRDCIYLLKDYFNNTI